MCNCGMVPKSRSRVARHGFSSCARTSSGKRQKTHCPTHRPVPRIGSSKVRFPGTSKTRRRPCSRYPLRSLQKLSAALTTFAFPPVSVRPTRPTLDTARPSRRFRPYAEAGDAPCCMPMAREVEAEQTPSRRGVAESSCLALSLAGCGGGGGGGATTDATVASPTTGNAHHDLHAATGGRLRHDRSEDGVRHACAGSRSVPEWWLQRKGSVLG